MCRGEGVLCKGSAKGSGVLQGVERRKAEGSVRRGHNGEQVERGFLGVPPTCCPPRQPGQGRDGGDRGSAEGIRGGCAVGARLRRGGSLSLPPVRGGRTGGPCDETEIPPPREVQGCCGDAAVPAASSKCH